MDEKLKEAFSNLDAEFSKMLEIAIENFRRMEDFNPATDSMDDYLLELVTNACYEAKTRSWSIASLIIVRAFLKLAEQLGVPCFGLCMQANDRVNILINNTPEEGEYEED